MGFLSPEWVSGTAVDVWGFYEKILGQRDSLPFWIDGIVVKIDDISAQNEMGESGGCPKGQTAIKFPPEGVETTLLGVQVRVGHTGAVAPTAVLAAVDIGGTTVRSATLSNYDQIAALNLAIGDTVLLERRGDVIPKVVRVTKRGDQRETIPVPVCCPECATTLGRKTTAGGKQGAVLYCLNDECPSRALGKVKCWISSLNILGIGDEVLEAMQEQAGINDAADLYTLKDRRSALANMTVSGIRFGESRAARVLAEIEAKRALTIDEFVGSLGLDSLAKTRVENIRAAVAGKMDTLDDWMSGKLTGLAEEASVPGLAARFVADIEKRRPLIAKLLDTGVTLRVAEPVAPKFVADDAKSFCMTGKFSQPKAFFQEKIAARGHEWKESVAKGLDYLVTDDPGSNSGKTVKARKLGVAIIGESELLAMLAS
jgi:DNA ligase (NAD+)